MKEVRAVNQTKDATLAGRVKVASNPWSRFWGLMGKRGLGEDEAVLIDPCYSVHTMFMRFPIDVVYLTKDNRVLKIADDMRPWRADTALACPGPPVTSATPTSPVSLAQASAICTAAASWRT